MRGGRTGTSRPEQRPVARDRLFASALPVAFAAGLLATAAPVLLGAGAFAAPPGAFGGGNPARTILTVAWVGDITPGSRYGVSPDSGRALFRAVRRDLQGPDLTIGNLEGTLSRGGSSKCGASDGGNCFSFQAPPGHAAGLAWAGFDAMNLANNHSFDFGAGAQRQTVAALHRRGIAHTGTPGRIAMVERRGVRVALMGFVPNAGTADLRDIAGARSLVRTASRHADLVVVLMHAGAEGVRAVRVPHGRERAFGGDRGNTRGFSHAVVDAGADLVLGSGPHVLRGMERYRGKLIAYSLGNFAGWKNFSRGGLLSLSGLLAVSVTGTGEVVGGRMLPLRLEGPGVPRPDGSGAAARLVDRLGRLDFGRRAVRLRGDGTLR